MEWSRRGALVALSLAVLASGAKAQEFPSRPLTMVVPFTPGAATDFLGRLLGKELEERLGKPVEWMVKTEEGHGFTQLENRVEFYSRLEAFMKRAIQRP